MANNAKSVSKPWRRHELIEGNQNFRYYTDDNLKYLFEVAFTIRTEMTWNIF